ALIKNGANKILIPAYRDMDPYDLPEEFSHLQAQDMSKLGFMQDLVRGINKLTSKTENEATVRETVVVNSEAGGNITAFIKRGFMALEDGDWEHADGFFEQALNFDAENAKAYLGKLMAELQVHTKDTIAEQNKPLEDSNNYKKAIRFGDNKLKSELETFNATIKERNEVARMSSVYNMSVDYMNSGRYKLAIEGFEQIIDYKDSKELLEKCNDIWENGRKEHIYNSACTLIAGAIKIRVIEQAIENLEEIGDYKDSREKIAEARSKIDEINRKIEEAHARREKQRQEELQHQKFENNIEKTRTILLGAVIAIILVLVVIASNM
ncbi:MAG: hypothetical protein IJ297_01640, partial [Clostridia bacterium]|nr:hypothetical protein [Clostridia bacterium]